MIQKSQLLFFKMWDCSEFLQIGSQMNGGLLEYRIAGKFGESSVIRQTKTIK